MTFYNIIYLYKITTNSITSFINIDRNSIYNYSIGWDKVYKQAIKNILVIIVVPSFCICSNVNQVFSMHNHVFDGGEDPCPPFEDITLLGSSGQERTSSSVENMPHSPEEKCEQCLQSLCYCLKGDFYRDRGWNEKVVLCAHVGGCMCLCGAAGGSVGALY